MGTEQETWALHQNCEMRSERKLKQLMEDIFGYKEDVTRCWRV